MIAPSMRGLSPDLQPVTRLTPAPGAQEVLIRMAYAGLNRADIFQRQGSYAPSEGVTDVPGLEVSGEIAATGEAVTRWRVGDRVCALLPGGGYAEYALAHADHCLPIPAFSPQPDTFPGAKAVPELALAAALPECVTTVWMALFATARLQAGETVLVHGGASGIGTTAIQMIRAAGAVVFATAGSDDKTALCQRLGATGINYETQDFVTHVKAEGGVDVVLDIVAGDYVAKNVKVLKPRGRLISLACLKGGQADVPVGSILLKQLSWHGLTLRNRTDAEKAYYIRQIEDTVWPWAAQGAVRPVIDSVWPLEQAAQAQEKMEKCLHCGKILLQGADI